MKGKKATKAAPVFRATLTCLPEGVVEVIVSHLHGNDKTHLALCCKALLPILGMGHVKVKLDVPESVRPLLSATRCLTRQPSGASHLELVSWAGCAGQNCVGTRHLIDLSLLTNLRKLTLHRVTVSLPALQPVATRLRELHLDASCLQGSADGFLTRGWTALTTLCLEYALVETATMTAALELPALEELDIDGFRHQGGVLQLDQITGSCPNITELTFKLDDCVMRGKEGSRSCCSLLNLGRLASLDIWTALDPPHAIVDLDLPPGLRHLTFRDASDNGGSVDFFGALNEAAKCIRRGAHLRKLVCIFTEADLLPVQWGTSLDEQYRRLGGQLSSLRELEVLGSTEELVSALCAVVSSAPHLTYVRFTIMEWLPCMELPPMCSASLESITVTVDEQRHEDAPPPLVTPLVLTFLPGCTRLRKVLVQFPLEGLTEGTAAKIRCHSGSSSCIVPMDARARAAKHMRVHGYANRFSEIGVRLLPGPPCPQGLQSHTVLYACRAAGPQKPLKWGHVVMPGFL